MKNKKKIPKLATIIYFAVALFLIVGCSVEHDLLEHANSKAIIHKRLTLEDLKSKKDIMQKLSDYSKEMHKITARNRNAEPLIVDISQANFIETDDFISYTFHMPTDSVPIRNFLLKKNKSDELGYQGYILDYNLTPEEFILYENKELHDLSNKVTSIHLSGEYNLGIFGRNTRQFTTCWGWVGYCHINDDGSYNATGHIPNTGYCIVSNYQFETFPCPDGGSAGGGGYNPGIPTNPTNPSPPNDGGGRTIVATPVNSSGSSNSFIQLTKTPCEELQNMTLNFALKNALITLSNQTHFNYETGFAVKKNQSDGNYRNPITANANDPTKPNEISAKDYLGSEFVGFFHTHPLSGGIWYPMFSPGDIDYLFWVALKHNTAGQPKQYSDYFITMTVPQGTFALKIKDISKFASTRNIKWKGDKGLEKVIIDNFDKRDPDGNINLLLKDLLDTFRKFDTGVGVYKANEDFSQWSEVVLETNPSSPNFGQPKLVPCN